MWLISGLLLLLLMLLDLDLEDLLPRNVGRLNDDLEPATMVCVVFYRSWCCNCMRFANDQSVVNGGLPGLDCGRACFAALGSQLLKGGAVRAAETIHLISRAGSFTKGQRPLSMSLALQVILPIKVT